MLWRLNPAVPSARASTATLPRLRQPLIAAPPPDSADHHHWHLLLAAASWLLPAPK